MRKQQGGRARMYDVLQLAGHFVDELESRRFIKASLTRFIRHARQPGKKNGKHRLPSLV